MRITKKDFEWAAEQGLILAGQAEALWRAFSERAAERPRFDLPHVLSYLGALVVIGAMGWYMTRAWEAFGGGGIFLISVAYAAVFLVAGWVLWGRPWLRVPAGLLVTMAVCMTPLAVYGLQLWLGVWPFGKPGRYTDFHGLIRGGWFAMEVATIAASLLALRFFRFPFLTAPLALILWFVSQDMVPILAGGKIPAQELRTWVSVGFGLAMMTTAYLADLRTREDYSFWGYLFGLIAFWVGLMMVERRTELLWFIFLLINLVLMGVSIFLQRRAFIVFGGLGVSGYIGRLAIEVFKDSQMFPFALSLVGMGILYLGIQLHRRGEQIERQLLGILPPWFLRLRPSDTKESWQQQRLAAGIADLDLAPLPGEVIETKGKLEPESAAGHSVPPAVTPEPRKPKPLFRASGVVVPALFILLVGGGWVAYQYWWLPRPQKAVDPRDAEQLTAQALRYKEQREFEKSETHFKRALAIREKALGAEHPDVAKSLHELALNYMAQRKFAEAEPLLRRVLAIRDKSLGPDHLLIALTLDNLAFTSQVRGNWDEASALSNRAREMREKLAGRR